MSIYVTHLTFVKPGSEETLLGFEATVLPLLKKYHAEVVMRVRPDHVSVIESTVGSPFEIHIIRFDNDDGLRGYLSDPARQAIMHVKEQAVLSTLTLISER